MIELPAALGATPADEAEAAAAVARIAGAPRSVAAALAADLAAGLRGRPVVISASGTAARLAADYWRRTLRAGGLEVRDEPGPEDAAWIWLHDGSGDPGESTYARDGGDLVGEVIGQGKSPAARYASLVAVANALSRAMAAEPGRIDEPELS